MVKFGLTSAIAAIVAAAPSAAIPLHPFDAVLTICHSTEMTAHQMHDGLVEAEWFPIAPADLPDETLQAFVARSASGFVGSDDAAAFRSHWEKQTELAWMNRLLPDADPTDRLRRFYMHAETFSLLQVSAVAAADGNTVGVGCSVTFASEIVPDWFRAIADEAIIESTDGFLQGISGTEHSAEWIAEAEVFILNHVAVNGIAQEIMRFEVIWDTKILSLMECRI